jgi:serine carboxypeptidase 1
LYSDLISEGSGVLDDKGKQKWGYVEVRPGAFMFWWLYYTRATESYMQKPWVIWLQGGPGASSTGYGNFEEIGPLDTSKKNRTHTWVDEANILFIDNPVGSGFSYVTNDSLLVKNNTQIAADLMTTVSKFLEKVPDFQTIPLYIFSESYGGKMAAQFALTLYKTILKGKIKCNLKGVNLGDSWISPIDSVLTWAPYLFSTSLVDETGFSAVNASAYAVKEAIEKGKYKTATALWDETETVMSKHTNGVNVYNILETSTDPLQTDEKTEVDDNRVRSQSVVHILKSFIDKTVHGLGESVVYDGKEDHAKLQETMSKLGAKHLKKYHGPSLSDLMNGPVKQMLRIIPANVTWGGQSSKVFGALAEDFMKPVVHVVNNLLNNTPVAVNVYNGQLDLIVDTMGTFNILKLVTCLKSQMLRVTSNSSVEL